MGNFNIVWTKIDEAPALATHALLPVVKAYARACGIEIETKDISLAGRVIANFPDSMGPEARAKREAEEEAQLKAMQEEAQILTEENKRLREMLDEATAPSPTKGKGQ